VSISLGYSSYDKVRSFGILVSYTAWFIKAKPAGRYAALINQVVYDGPESGDGEGTAKAALASGRAQAQGLMTVGPWNHWIACQASDDHFFDLFAPICERSQKNSFLSGYTPTFHSRTPGLDTRRQENTLHRGLIFTQYNNSKPSNC
jgi:hypothetical protein